MHSRHEPWRRASQYRLSARDTIYLAQRSLVRVCPTKGHDHGVGWRKSSPTPTYINSRAGGGEFGGLCTTVTVVSLVSCERAPGGIPFPNMPSSRQLRRRTISGTPDGIGADKTRARRGAHAHNSVMGPTRIWRWFSCVSHWPGLEEGDSPISGTRLGLSL